ncbi:argininosuccinate lyase [Acidianus sp. HS-5]|uniref:argininosuccinate lyase n=1 Tax=Acidianus sp. HS-5 TaxID=2886040 RepID=UPI001F00C27F|nr:argininosuccinate lyase [Acidianus sp. HS-5]BDC19613.1 argininosuccinate lyase [Acidianus sp. HS-5]
MLYRKWGSSGDEVISFTSSVEFDNEIINEVKLTMKAHVIELYLDKIINKETAGKIISAINEFKEIPSGYEDIHEALEDYIIKKVGEEGGWIGLGRSRNDHVATALRLKSREELLSILDQLIKLREVLLDKADKFVDVIFPSFTHLQPAQPTTFGHYLAYIEEELYSAWELLFSNLKLINRSPLGSGAIVGSNVSINREREAEMLGFDEIITNTISATSSRIDLISSVGSIVSLLLVLSRIAEDMVIFSSMKLVKLPDNQVSTSSLMPQKRNPVTMEIMRAKAGELIGFFTSLSSMYKGLPSGYDLDMQEMNKYYWYSFDYAKSSISVLKSLFEGIEVLQASLDYSMLATDEAESLSLQGIPYRKAYFEVSSKVMKGTFTPSINFKESINSKKTEGSPNPGILKNDIKKARDRIEENKSRLNEFKTNVSNKISQLRAIENDLQEGL